MIASIPVLTIIRVWLFSLQFNSLHQYSCASSSFKPCVAQIFLTLMRRTSSDLLGISMYQLRHIGHIERIRSLIAEEIALLQTDPCYIKKWQRE